MRTVPFLLTVVLSVSPAAAVDTTRAEPRLDRLEHRLNAIVAKAGISFNGEFRSQMLWSGIDGPGASDTRRTQESVEYTLVDFDVQARPNEAISGRVVFRMYQDWRNFFSDISNPIFSRWISIDGTVKGMWSYHVGDLRARYSPLTLWSPDIEIPYEPAVFARLRTAAMAEEFLGNNDRLLQGISAGLDAELAPLLKELHVNILASRLRTAQTSIQNGSQVVTALEAAKMDKYLVGANIDAVVLPQLTFGGTFLDIFDAVNTGGLSDTVIDTMAQQTAIWAVRGGVGTGTFLSAERFSVALNAEFASSHDDSAWWNVEIIDTLSGATHHTLQSRWITGQALSIRAAARLAPNASSHVTLDAGYLSTAKDYRNELAQSPSFIGQRIMNIENDSLYRAANWHWTTPSTHVPDHYSTYDALYRQVFKFAPSQATNNWAMAPFRKISYSRTILTQHELAIIEKAWLDPAVQLVMPFGAATPNRQGVRLALGAELMNGAVDVRGGLDVLSQIEGDSLVHIYGSRYDSGAALPGGGFAGSDTTLLDTAALLLPATAYIQAGGGFALDIGRMIPAIARPIKVSLGAQFARAANDGATGYVSSAYEVSTLMLNAGLYANVWKRLSLLGGYQFIDVSAQIPSDDYVRTRRQSQWAAGLEYKVGEGGVLTGTIGQIQVRNADTDPTTTGVLDPSARDFDQWQCDIHLTVFF